ncbi:MAG: sensor histidine kinase, partial [Chloroflexota bacterium]|nr:sensor histidine kinase [Chloroflexota bacterium]
CPPDGDGGPRLAVHVSDTGPGIPLGERERVFERFHRGVERIDRRAGGSGLGLAICKAIVLAHGGQMRVADGEGGGTDGRVREASELSTQGHYRPPFSVLRYITRQQIAAIACFFKLI